MGGGTTSSRSLQAGRSSPPRGWVGGGGGRGVGVGWGGRGLRAAAPCALQLLPPDLGAAGSAPPLGTRGRGRRGRFTLRTVALEARMGRPGQGTDSPEVGGEVPRGPPCARARQATPHRLRPAWDSPSSRRLEDPLPETTTHTPTCTDAHTLTYTHISHLLTPTNVLTYTHHHTHIRTSTWTQIHPSPDTHTHTPSRTHTWAHPSCSLISTRSLT